MRTEFAPGHKNHGEIHFKSGKRVRTQFFRLKKKKMSKITQYIVEETDDE